MIMRMDQQLPSSKLINLKATRKDYILSLINQQTITSSYIKIKTTINNFQPIYSYKILQKYKNKNKDKDRDRDSVGSQNRRSKDNRNSNYNMGNNSKLNNQSVMEQPVLRYGSQLFLRDRGYGIVQRMNSRANSISRQKVSEKHKAYGVNSIQAVSNQLYPDYAFFQILMENMYLTQKQSKQILLSVYTSNQSLWVIQQVPNQNTYRLFNAISCRYLCVETIQYMNGQKYMLGLTQNIDKQNTQFTIKPVEFDQNGYFTLTPYSRSPKIYKPQSSPLRISHNDKNINLLQRQTRIQIVPIQNSVANLLYQLKFAQQMITNNPSIQFFHEFIQQLIFYTIPQFGQNEGLLSDPIQKLLAQTGLSLKMLNFIMQQINQHGYRKQIADLISNDIRLLCLGSQENSAIYKRLISKILDLYQYKDYIKSMINLIHHNYYFINSFQSAGWPIVLQKKLQITYSIQQFQTFHGLLKLVGQFCVGTYSIPNKYLVMHTLQKLFDQNQKPKKSMSSFSEEQEEKQNFWIRLFQQGQYMFVQKQVKGDYKQIQLQTYLNENQHNQLVYMGQIYMISSLCSGFNINAINRYYHILKAVSAYCYNQTYPFFQNSRCKQATLQAIVASLDWNDNNRKLQNKCNIGCVFTNSDINKVNDKTQLIRQRNVSKNNKIEISKLNKNIFNRQNESLTDVFKHFILAFQSHMLSVFKISKQNNISVVDMVLSNKQEIQKKFGGNIVHWIKIIAIALDARLITLLKKKAGPYTQYFKKIFEPKKSPQKSKSQQQKNQSPSKNASNRRSSPSSLPFIPDKQYDTQVNIIFDLIIRLIKYNPLYQMYLQQLDIKRNSHTKTNKQSIVQKVLNIRKSNSFFKQSKQSIQQIQNYNKVIVMDELLLDSQKQLIQHVNEVKQNCYKVLSLSYQNIIQELIEYEIKNLGYFVQGSIKFVNNLTLEQGFRKLPFTDESFRLSLLQNWYMTSNPLVLDQITNVMRYIYDQQQIYLRCLNSTLALFLPEVSNFYEQIQPAFGQVQRLTMCIQVWYIPQILKSFASYEQNYHILLRALQVINGHIKKVIISNQYILNEYQQILQNLGCIDIFDKLIRHLGKFQKKKKKRNKIHGQQRKNEQFRQMDKQQNMIFAELTKIIQFYVYLNSNNKCKLLVLLGQVLTSSMSSFEILLFLIKQQTGLQTYISLITKKSLVNIINMIPAAKQFLELILVLPNFQFICIVHQISLILVQSNEKINGDDPQQNLKLNDRNSFSEQLQKRIIEDHSCFLLFSKIAYRLIQIGDCCSLFLAWLYDKLLIAWLENEISTNMNFSPKIMQITNIDYIQISSCVAYLIYSMYFNKTLLKMHERLSQKSLNLSNQSYFNNLSGDFLKSPEGLKLLNNYITKQIFATVLQNQSNIMAMYISYYIYDLLPLLAIFNNNRMLKNEQLKRNVLEKSKQYLKIYTQLSEKSQQIVGSSKSQNQIKLRPKYMIIQEHKGFQLNVDKKLKQIQLFLDDPTLVQSFKPRSKYIQPAFRPQFVHRQPHRLLSPPQKQKIDQFQKMSKKAIKLWYKAKLTANENKQNFMNRDKWFQDIQKLQLQYQGSEKDRKDKQKMINSNDLLAKTISILVNASILKLSPQNLNFLLKNCINWVSKKVDSKVKKQKKLMKMDSSINKNKSESKYLIKKFQTTTVIISILQQITIKLSGDQRLIKNVISLCYMLKLTYFLYQLISQPISISTSQKIVYKIVQIMDKLINYFQIHKFLLQQLQNTKQLDTWQVMSSWNPINLLIQFVQIFIKTYGRNASIQQLQLIGQAFVKAKIRLERVDAKNTKLDLGKIFVLLNQISQHDFKLAQQKLLENEQLYKNLKFFN